MSPVPIKDAVVEIRNQDYVLIAKKLTDENGIAKFYLPKGVYYIKAYKEEYGEHEQQLILTSNYVKEAQLGVPVLTKEYSGLNPYDLTWAKSDGWSYLLTFHDMDDCLKRNYAIYYDPFFPFNCENCCIDINSLCSEYGGGYGMFNGAIFARRMSRIAFAMKLDLKGQPENAGIIMLQYYDANMKQGTFVLEAVDYQTNKVRISGYKDTAVELTLPRDFVVFLLDFENLKLKIFDKYKNQIFEDTISLLSHHYQLLRLFTFSVIIPAKAYSVADFILDWFAVRTEPKTNVTIPSATSSRFAYWNYVIENSEITDFIDEVSLDLFGNKSKQYARVDTEKTVVYFDVPENEMGELIHEKYTGGYNEGIIFLLMKNKIIVPPPDDKILLRITTYFGSTENSRIEIYATPNENILKIKTAYQDRYSTEKEFTIGDKYYHWVFDPSYFRVVLMSLGQKIIDIIEGNWGSIKYEKFKIEIYEYNIPNLVVTKTLIDGYAFNSTV